MNHSDPVGKTGRYSYPGPILLLGMVIFGFITAAIVMQAIPSSGPMDAITGYSPVNLTPEEQVWIADHPEIRVCPDQNYPPFEQITKSEDYQGISADLLREVAKNTGLKISVSHEKDWESCIAKIKNGSVDVLGAVYVSSLRNDYLIYSEPYYRSLLPIITRLDTRTDMTLEEFAGKRVASVGEYTTTLLLREKYPDITIVPVPDVRSGLMAVSLGSADAYFGDLAASTYYVDSEGISNLHVAGSYMPESPDEFSYAFGVRKDAPELVSIINKGIRAIPPEKRDEIFRRWISPTLTKNLIDPALILLSIGIVAALLLVTGGVILWNRALTHVVSEKTCDLERELTEHKKTADTLLITRFTVDHSHAMFLWIDSRMTIRDFNETFCQETGYSREEIRDLHLSALHSHLTDTKVNELFARVRKEGRIKIETDIRIKSGAGMPVEIMLWYFTFEGNEWFCAEMQNITERNRYEAERENAITQIQRNLAELSLLNDGIRNPLTVILGATEMYGNEGIPLIEEQVRRIDAMINQLDQRWNESEKIFSYLKKHYGVTVKEPENSDGNQQDN
nr:transporter substrate-binding domain-containing protein [uncultured Methanospirillum sp.]